MEGIVAALDHTPWWVYLLFGYLLTRGLKGMKDGTVSVKKLAIMPSVMAVFGLVSLVTDLPLNALSLGSWIVGLGAGALLGWHFGMRRALRVDPKAGRVWRRGSPLPLLLMLLIFAVKYSFGYLSASQPDLVDDPAFYVTDMGVSGLVTGFFFGQFASVLARLRDPATPRIEATG